MYLDDLQEKVEALSRNEQFTAQLTACKSTSEVAALLASEGIVISDDEIEQVLNASQVPTDGELDENMLDNVAGGASLVGRLRNILLPLLPLFPLLPNLPAFPLPVQPIRKFRK